MGFVDRLEQTNKLVTILTDGLWENAVIRQRMVHVNYGAEHIVPQEVHELIRHTRTETTRHIKFTPDFFVVDRRYPERTYLLEYKCTQTPLYSRNRIEMIRKRSPRKEIDWQEIGQWEAEAYDNYRALAKLGVRVAILNYCAYHSRLLVCDFVERVTPLYRDRVRSSTMRGSRTPFINFDLTSMRSLEEFLVAEHGFDIEQVKSLCANVKRRLQAELPVTHHPRSPLYGR